MAVPLTNPRALLGMLTSLAGAAINLGADTGMRRPVDVTATLDGRVIARQRAWTEESVSSLVAAMTEDADRLPLDEFQRLWG